MKIEICANSYESAINAEKGEADRIELCSELAVGGITPSLGLIKKVIKDVTIPVNVLIRPRSGNFSYSNSEFDVMKNDIIFCKEQGCNGIVSGVLLNDNTIDKKRTRELIELTKPLSFTFHRAFDWVDKPLEALEVLISLGAQRILTSGQKTAATKGINLLKQLHQQGSNRIIVLPGGGININNIMQFKSAGFREVHFSATKLHKSSNSVKISLNSPQFFDETKVVISDFNKIKVMVNLVK